MKCSVIFIMLAVLPLALSDISAQQLAVQHPSDGAIEVYLAPDKNYAYFDVGGAQGDYSASESGLNSTTFIAPPNHRIVAEIIDLDLERSGAHCMDQLIIEGIYAETRLSNTSESSLTLCGLHNEPTRLTSGYNGYLTVRLVSDDFINKSGWRMRLHVIPSDEANIDIHDIPVAAMR